MLEGQIQPPGLTLPITDVCVIVIKQSLEWAMVMYVVQYPLQATAYPLLMRSYCF